jgi:hypothetical protein
MSDWAAARRLDYIDGLLATRGELNLGDLVEAFGLHRSQASKDINEFIRLYPDALVYDKVAKRYVPANGRYKRQRRLSAAERETLAIILASRRNPCHPPSQPINEPAQLGIPDRHDLAHQE